MNAGTGILALAMTLVLMLVLAATAAWSGSNLVRLTDRDDLLGWEAIGRLDMAGVGFCTGTLIAPDLVLTAAHCVYDKRQGSLLQADALLFRAGLRDGVAIAERRIRQIAVDPGYRPGPRPTNASVRKDVALLRLANPIYSTDADPFVLHSGKVEGQAVSVVSYGQGRSAAPSRQRNCQLLQAAQNLMAFDCNVTFGSSGSPVFARVGNRGRILSVISGMGAFNGQKIALGMSLPALVASLKAQLRRAPVAAADRPVRRIRIGSSKHDTGAKFVRP